MTCRRSVSEVREWRSTAMNAASDLAGRFAFSSPPSPGGWRSCMMQTLEAAVTPGTTANLAASLAVTTLVLPRIPNRFIAAAAGFVVGSVLRGEPCPAPEQDISTRSR